MNETINQDCVFEFIKLLVETGGIYKVNDDKMVVLASSGAPHTIVSNKKTLPLMVFHNRIPIGDHVVLNPLKDSIGVCPERVWFFNFIKNLPGGLLQRIIFQVVRDLVESDTSKKDTVNYTQLSMLAPFATKVDKKMLDEIGLLGPDIFLEIFYSKKTKTAQLQSRLWDDEATEEYGNKIRKKTWTVLRDMTAEFMRTAEISEAYQYKATIIGSQEADAVLHVFLQILQVLQEPAQAILGMDLHAAELTQHMEHLEKYYKLCSWFTSTTSKSAPETTIAKAPWENLVPTPKVPSGAIINGPIEAQPIVNTDRAVVPQPAASSIPQVPTSGTSGVPMSGRTAADLPPPTVVPPAAAMPMGMIPGGIAYASPAVPGGGISYAQPSRMGVGFGGGGVAYAGGSIWD